MSPLQEGYSQLMSTIKVLYFVYVWESHVILNRVQQEITALHCTSLDQPDDNFKQVCIEAEEVQATDSSHGGRLDLVPNISQTFRGPLFLTMTVTDNASCVCCRDTRTCAPGPFHNI